MLRSFLLQSVLLVFFVAPAFASEIDDSEYERPCLTSQGEEGICVPIVQCPYGGQSDTDCELGSVDGVCCLPLQSGRTEDSSNFLLQSTSPRRTSLRLESNDFAPAVERASRKLAEKDEKEKYLVLNNIVPQKGSPSYRRNAYFNSSSTSIRARSRLAEIAIAASQDLAQRHDLSKSQVKQALESIDLRQTDLAESCPEVRPCPGDPMYRTIDGSCNNEFDSSRGQAGTPFVRFMYPRYDDDVGSPKVTSVSGKKLKSAREISQALTITSDALEIPQLTLMLMQWGQFLDHDITSTPMSRGEGDSAIECCTEDGDFLPDSDTHPECFPIPIPDDDPFFSQFGQKCMSFVRSLASVPTNCVAGHREQINALPSYIDANTVYGSDEERQNRVRLQGTGLLKSVISNGQELMPPNPEDEDCDREEPPYCFLAGDERANEQAYLAVMHTLWMREHNRIARELQRLQRSIDPDVLYEEARRIVGAEIQHITYNEWLPIILGRKYMTANDLLPQQSGYSDSYSPRVTASVTNAFSTAAFRFGHTLVNSFIKGFTESGKLNLNEDLSFSQNRPFQLFDKGVVDAMLRGLTVQRSQLFDNLFTGEITNRLFAQNESFGMDLVALNVQRGRDHGLPSYNEFRKACHLPFARNFRQLEPFFADPTIVRTLRTNYDNVDDIDLFIGGVLEPSVEDGLLGETFQCIIGEQFIRLKTGDRFFYENGEFVSRFTPGQLRNIRRVSLSRIICDNSDITEMQPLAFLGDQVTASDEGPFNDLNGRRRNRKRDCDRLPRVDLSVFAF